MRTTAAWIVSVLALGCGGGSGSGGADKDSPDTASPDEAQALDAIIGDVREAVAGDPLADTVADKEPDATPDDAQPEPDAPRPPPLFTRPDKGAPVTPDEIAAATETYLAVLRGTRYFDVVEERAHGWPESDPQGRYWFATWWSGVRVLKQDGRVTYRHSADGADNNGMRTAPILAAACFADALWGGRAHLVRRLARGFNSWVLAMERASGPDTGVLMTRAHYPESVTSWDGGREVFIDYSLNRPGEDNDATVYVHNPDNPYWGDIYIKNKRSKDDIGHMLLTLALLPACTGDVDPAFREDLDRLGTLYGAWARRVEDDGWRIATVDRDFNVYWPEEDLAFFIDLGNIECKAMLAIRLVGRGDEGPLACGDGLSALDEIQGLKNDFHQIQRSFHEAAAALALFRGRPDIADAMLHGLAWRLDTLMDARESPTPPPVPGDQDLAELVTMSAVVGVPLTSREVRFLHARIDDAYQTYLSQAMMPHYRVFDPDTPDGEYAFTPDAGGFFWRYLGTLLGLCASPYRNPSSRPVLDCDAIRAAGPATMSADEFRP